MEQMSRWKSRTVKTDEKDRVIDSRGKKKREKMRRQVERETDY